MLPGGGVAGFVYGPHPRGYFSSENTCGQPGGALVVRQNEIPRTENRVASRLGDTDAPPPVAASNRSRYGSGLRNAATRSPSLEWIAPATRGRHHLWAGRALVSPHRGLPGLLHRSRAASEPAGCRRLPRRPLDLGALLRRDRGRPGGADLERSERVDADPGVKRGRQSVGVEAADVGGGLSSVSLSVNGLPPPQPKTSMQRRQTQNASVAGTVAAQITPCPTEAEANWTLDTGSYPFRDGANGCRYAPLTSRRSATQHDLRADPDGRGRQRLPGVAGARRRSPQRAVRRAPTPRRSPSASASRRRSAGGSPTTPATRSAGRRCA